jgi:hypothetical protein
MTLGARLLRMKLRLRIATSAAHTEDLSRTLTVSTDAIRLLVDKYRSDNDPQHIVQFETFAAICEHRGRAHEGMQLCAHEKAIPGQVCDQHECPLIVGEIRRDVA